MNRALSIALLLLVAAGAPASAGSQRDREAARAAAREAARVAREEAQADRDEAQDEATREAAKRFSAELDRALRETRMAIAAQRSLPKGAVLLEDGTVLLLDGAELKLDDFEWVDAAQGRRPRREAHTDTVLRVGPGVTLSLQNLAGDIKVVTWDRNEVRVQAQHDRSDQLVTELRNDVVTLGVGPRHASNAEVEWTLTVPAWLPLELGGIESEIAVSGLRSSVRAQSVRGDVSVMNCQGPLEVYSTEGEVHVTDVSGNVTASSINSLVRILRVVGPIEVQSVNGDIQLEKVESPNVDASSLNGRVYYASRYQPRGRYSLSSHGGNVVAPAPNQSVKMSLSSYQGQVESSVPVPAQEPGTKRHPYKWQWRDGTFVPATPTAPPAPRSPRAPRGPRATPAPNAVPAAANAPQVELESFSGLIRITSEHEIQSLLSARRAAMDSARSLYTEGRRKIEQSRRLMREVRQQEIEARKRRMEAQAQQKPENRAPAD